MSDDTSKGVVFLNGIEVFLDTNIAEQAPSQHCSRGGKTISTGSTCFGKIFVGERRVLFDLLHLDYSIVLLLRNSVKYAKNQSSDRAGTSKMRFVSFQLVTIIREKVMLSCFNDQIFAHIGIIFS